MNQQEIQQEVDKRKWRHTIDLNGVVTPGDVNTPQVAARRLLKPEIFKNKRVLDIGAWDGFYSFMAEKWGAESVLAIDVEPLMTEKGTRANFEFSKKVLQSSAELIELNLFDLDPEKHGFFDVVLFMGVLYHLQNPLLAFEAIKKVMPLNGLLVVESATSKLSNDDCFVVVQRGGRLKLFPTPGAIRKALDYYEFEIVDEIESPSKKDVGRIVFHAKNTG